MLKTNLLTENRMCKEKCLGAGFFSLHYRVRTRHSVNAQWSKEENLEEESFYKYLLFHLGNTGLQGAVKTISMKRFLAWITFPETDILKVCKIRMAFKCILTVQLGWKSMKLLLPAHMLQENSRRMCFFPQPLSKNHWDYLNKTSLTMYNRILYSFSPASFTLDATSTHAVAMMQVLPSLGSCAEEEELWARKLVKNSLSWE